MDIKIDEQRSFDENSIYRDTRSIYTPVSLLKTPPTANLPSDPQVMNKLENYHTKYVASLAKVSELKIKDIQASFEDYLRLADRALNEPFFLDHMPSLNDSKQILQKRSHNEAITSNELTSDQTCSKNSHKSSETKMIVRKYKIGCLDSPNELEERMIQGELRTDFYTYYIVLNKIWSSEYIRKSDVKQLQPCKVLLLRSMVKRKFDEELTLKWAYKWSIRHKKPFEYSPIQNSRKAFWRI